MRLDSFLVERKIFISREKAKDLILKGGVRVNPTAINKPSVQVVDSDIIECVKEKMLPYVSKGGLKLEKTNFRSLRLETISQKVDVVVGDLSFISLIHILKNIPVFLKDDGFVVLLIKPQFEVGPKHIGKGGIVKNSEMHISSIQRIVNYAQTIDLGLLDLTNAPIIIPQKNIEYLALFKRNSRARIDISKIVASAFLEKEELAI